MRQLTRNGCLAGILGILALVGVASGAIQKVYLGNIDATPSVVPSPPTSVSLIASGTGPLEIWEYASYVGPLSSNPLVRSSPTGVTWTNSPTNMGGTGTYCGFTATGSRWMGLRDQTGAALLPVQVVYSDNSGVSWSTIDLTDMQECGESSGFYNELRCSGASCLAIGQDVPSGTVRSKIYRSIDSGSSWSLVFTSSYTSTFDLAAEIGYWDGTTAIIQVFIPATNGRALTSLDGGSTYTVATMTGSTNHQCGSAASFGGNYYMLCATGTSDLALWRSTNSGVSWSNLGRPSGITGTTFGNAQGEGLACFSNYDTPTCYLAIRPLSDNLLRVYTSTDASTWTIFYTHANTTPTAPKHIFQDSNNDLWFATQNNYVFKIS